MVLSPPAEDKTTAPSDQQVLIRRRPLLRKRPQQSMITACSYNCVTYKETQYIVCYTATGLSSMTSSGTSYLYERVPEEPDLGNTMKFVIFCMKN